MSWLTSGLKAVGGVAKKIGDAVNPGAAAIRGVAGGVAQGKGAGQIASDQARNFVTNSARGAAGGAVIGAGALAMPALGGALGLGGAGAAGSTAGAGGVGGLLVGGLKSIGGFALHNPELIAGAASTIMGAKQASQAGKLQDQVLDLARQQYADAAPLRAAGLAALAHPSTPDLGWMTAGAPGGGNPYLAGPAPASIGRLPSRRAGARPGALV